MTAWKMGKTDTKKAAKALGKQGFVELREFFAADDVKGFRNMESRLPPWSITFRDNNATITLTGIQRQSMTDRRWRDKQGKAFELTRLEHQFYHLTRPLLDQEAQDGFPDDPFPQLADTLGTSEFAELISEIAGEPSLKLLSADALLLGFNNFRSRMRYSENGPSAHHFVFIELTQEWKPDWGGLLQFYTDEGDVSGGLVPRFNSLVVIRSDKDFGISFIPSFVYAQHYSIMATFAAE